MTLANESSPWLAPADQHEGSSAATATRSYGGEELNVAIPQSSLVRVVRGIAVATERLGEQIELLVQGILSLRISETSSSNSATRVDKDDTAASLAFCEWQAVFHSRLVPHDEGSQQLANLALGIASLREIGRNEPEELATALSADKLQRIWAPIHDALKSRLLPWGMRSATRSASGFVAIPLCTLKEGGNFTEFFELHVWLPDSRRNDFVTIQSHQFFAQTWVLTGERKKCSFEIEQVTDSALATHAEYGHFCRDEKSISGAYQTHHANSPLAQTGTCVRAVPTGSKVYRGNTTYSIHAATYHATDIAPDAFHASLSFFDSSRGFVKNAHFLGPKDGELFTLPCNLPNETAACLVSMVDAVRLWETMMEQGKQHAWRAEWEYALRALNSALDICETREGFPNRARYRSLVLGKIGSTNRQFGRYEQAKDHLEMALAIMGPSLPHIKLRGELGVVYRQMNRLMDAKRAFEMEYDMAKELEYEHGMCRAVGNLGMVNYQLSQERRNDFLLDLATEQLLERIQRAQHIREQSKTDSTDRSSKFHRITLPTIWESIGLSRLSLCYSTRGKVKEAVASASKSLELNSSAQDPTVVAMSRFYYGRTLLLAGETSEAMKQFNPRNTCTPAMALCKEPSEECRGYLKELVAAGADMDLVDDHGYTALDYAIFCNDAATAEVVLEGLRRSLSEDVEQKVVQRLAEARLRKGYRELFQEKLRPVLLRKGFRNDVLRDLRRIYARTLAVDEEKREMFDKLKVIQYRDFSRFGNLPRSKDGVVQEVLSDPDSKEHESATDFVIFFSYRWINKDPGATSPDDAENTQYRRMIEATEEFLRRHPLVEREKLGVWVVSPT